MNGATRQDKPCTGWLFCVVKKKYEIFVNKFLKRT